MNDKQIWGRGDNSSARILLTSCCGHWYSAKGWWIRGERGLDLCPGNLRIYFHWKVLLLPSPDMRHSRQSKRTRNTSRQPSGSKQCCSMLLFITLLPFDHIYIYTLIFLDHIWYRLGYVRNSRLYGGFTRTYGHLGSPILEPPLDHTGNNSTPIVAMMATPELNRPIWPI